ncbi:hypothetical protein C2E23DRAFT_882602 [Lenzites betulinus]|nr:hypothetical protein C2E23DRAFT_882602 [Lenzites betulinus]
MRPGGGAWKRSPRRFAFSNVGTVALETCLVSIIRSASSSINTCFGSLQNLLSTEGLCLANSGSWEVSVSHT